MTQTIEHLPSRAHIVLPADVARAVERERQTIAARTGFKPSTAGVVQGVLNRALAAGLLPADVAQRADRAA